MSDTIDKIYKLSIDFMQFACKEACENREECNDLMKEKCFDQCRAWVKFLIRGNKV